MENEHYYIMHVYIYIILYIYIYINMYTQTNTYRTFSLFCVHVLCIL